MKNAYYIVKLLLLIIELYLIGKGAKIMKKITNWLKSNKGAIASILTFILSITDLVFGWVLGDKTFYVGGFNIVALVTLGISIIIGVCSSGFTSASLQDAFNKVKEQLKLDKHNGLTVNERAKMGKKINMLEKKKVELTKANQVAIDNVRLFQIGTSEEREQVNRYDEQINKLNSQIKILKDKLGDK